MKSTPPQFLFATGSLEGLRKQSVGEEFDLLLTLLIQHENTFFDFKPPKFQPVLWNTAYTSTSQLYSRLHVVKY